MCLKLLLALFFDLIKSPRVEILLLFDTFLYCDKGILGVFARLLILLLILLLFAICSLHTGMQLQVAVSCTLQLFVLHLLDVLLNIFRVLLVPLIASFVEFLVVLFGHDQSLFALLCNLSKLVRAVVFFIGYHLLVALSIRLVLTLLEDELRGFFHS